MLFQASLFALLLAGSSLARPQRDFNSQVALEEPFNPYPVYTYSYQVADDTEQTYIAHEENRDGEDVKGEYSYVDPTGDLIRVTYRAGANGYTEERSVEPAFIKIRSRPATTSQRTTSSSSDGNQGAVVRVAPQSQRVVSTTTSNSNGNGDLVARILAQLTPFIQQTVSSSLTGGARSGPSTTTTRVSSAPVATSVRTFEIPAAPIPVASTASSRQSSSAVQGIFGSGGANNVRFNTPEFNYEFDLN